MADEPGAGPETAIVDTPAAKGTWRRLLGMVVGLTILTMIVVTVFAGFIPPFVVFFVLFVVGWWLLGRGGKAGPIVLIIGFVAFVVLSAPFIIPSLTVPAAAGDFITGWASIVLGIVGLIAAIAALRGGDATPSAAPRTTGRVLAAILILSVVVGVVARVTYDEPARAAEDISLTAADFEFSSESLEADGGEVSVYVTNEDQTIHTFTIDDLDVDLVIPGGTSARVTFDAEPGTYEFYCVPHEEDMEGELTVQ